MEIEITSQDKNYCIVSSYDPNLVSEIRNLPGRKWDKNAKVWKVPKHAAVQLSAMLARLDGWSVKMADDLRAEINSAQAATEAKIEQSKAADADIDIPVPDGLSYLPYQRAGIAYALGRKNVLLGDEMGLGKTVEAIGVSNADPTIKSVLIICPASLRLNWMREWRKWDTRNLTVGMASSTLPSTDVVVINYDILKKHIAAIHARKWDLLICDEAHYLKNAKAQRTALVVGKWNRDKAKIIPPIEADRKLMLTGTPIPNRPIEGYTIFKTLAPEIFSNWKNYAVRYCDGHDSRYGWDVTGASNLGELQEKLRASIMVRRLKEDVLTELPPKRRQIIEIEGNQAAVEKEQSAWTAHLDKMQSLRVAVELSKGGNEQEYRSAVDALSAGASAAFSEMSKIRHATALAKVPLVIEHLTDALEGGKIVCFAHHRDVIAKIVEAFPGSVQITGDTKLEDRQAAVDRFQTDAECKLFVGNIQAAGVGITLTASAHVVFAELDWVPGNISQAEDRTHRIGQKQSVLIQHLVLEGSLDSVMAKRLVEKQAVIDQALDDAPVLNQEPAIPVSKRDQAATESTSRKKISELAEKLTADQISAIHEGLRMLAGVCDGAHSLDGAGFNKMDAAIGHSLANAANLTPRQAALGSRLINKYRRQLPENVVTRAKEINT